MTNAGEPIATLQAENARLRQRVAELEQAVTEARYAEETYRALAEHSLHGIVIVQDERVVFVNSVAAGTAGYSVDEILAMTLDEIKAMLDPEDKVRLCAYHQTCLAGEAPSSPHACRLVRKDGMPRWIEVSMAFIQYRNRPAVQMVFSDITERRRAEQALVETERFTQSVLDSLSAHIAVLDAEGTIVAVNRAWRSFAEENQLIGDTIGMNYLHVCDMATGAGAEEAARFAAGIRAVHAGLQDSFECEYPCDSPNEKRWFVGRVTRFGDAEASYIVVAHENITARKLAEEALRASQALLQGLLDHAPAAIFVKDFQGRLILINRHTAGLTGHTPEEMVGKLQEELFPSEKVARWVEEDRAVVQGAQPLEIEDTATVNGQKYTYLTKKFPIYDDQGTIIAIGAFSTDITRRKRAEEALRASETQFRAFFEQAPVGIGVSRNGITLIVNPAFLRMFGYTDAAELVGKPITEQIAPEERASVLERARRRWRDEAVETWFEVTGMRKDGTRFLAICNVGRIVLMDGQPASVAFFTDITEQKRVEAELRDSEELFRSVWEVTSDAMVLSDADGIVVAANPAYFRLYGYPPEVVIGHAFALIYPPEMRSYAMEHYHEIFVDGQAVPPIEATVRRADGAELIVEARAEFIQRSDEQVLMLSTIRDITERIRTERALRASEAQNRALIEAIPDAIVRLRRDGTRVNVRIPPDYVRIAPDVMKPEKHLADFLPQDLVHQILVNVRHTLETQSVWTSEYSLQTEEGTHVFEGRMVPLGDDEVLCILRNITDRYQSQKALQEAHALLEQRVEERTAELRQVNRALQDEIIERNQVATALRESQTLLQSILDNVPAAVYVRDVQNRYLLANKYMLTELGLKHDDIVGKHITEVFSPEVSQIIRADTQRILATCEPITQERVTQLPGGMRTLLTTNFPIVDSTGAIIGIGGIATDITQHKQTEEAYRTLVEHSLQALLIFQDNRIVFANPMAEVITGYTVEEMLAMPPDAGSQIIHPDDHPMVFAYGQARLAHQPTPSKYEFRIIRKDGGVRWVEETGTAIEYRGTTGLQSAFIDITDRKLAEEALRERTAELSVTNAELAQAVRSRDEFLANMSHELRTPLNAVLGLTEILQEEVYGPLNERQRSSLRTIEDSGRHLLDLINDVLDLAKIEAGKIGLEMNAVLVEMVCHNSMRIVQQMAQKKRLIISEYLDPQVTFIQADERRLRQIMVNLLSNAVKFTPEGGKIGLEVEGDRNRRVVNFTVWDTGIGIAPEHVDKLFRPFVQIDSGLDRQYEGTGLGLALVARLAELHGGSVTLQSEVGAGSRFTVSLPWNEAPAGERDWRREAAVQRQPAPAAPLPFPSSSAPLILIAEDNINNSATVADYLLIQGFRVDVAHNGLEAIQHARRERPNLILMDIQMPEMDGIEATRHIRADMHLSAVPIIALTALVMPGDRERCLDAGANMYLSKPISLKRLVQIIREYV